MNRRCWIAGVSVGLFMIVAHAFAIHLVEGSDPRAKPMKEALGALVEQIVAGDFEKAKAIYAGGGADLELLKAYVDDVRVAKAMRAAIDSKFGDNAGKNLRGIDEEVTHMGVHNFNTVIFLDDPDRASSSADSPLGIGIEFQRVEGKWKVLSLASAPATPREHLARLREYHSVVQAITEKVKSGGYLSAETAKQEANAAEARLWPKRTGSTIKPSTRPTGAR